jgi:hypothetical protein
MISNGEQLNIVSQAQFREQRDSVIGGRRNVTLVTPDRQERPEVSVQWEEIMRLVSTKEYIDEATGKTRFSEIVGVNETNYTYDMISEFVKNRGYQSATEWYNDIEGGGLRHYAAAQKRGWEKDICVELGLKHKKFYTKEMFDEFMNKYNPVTKKEFDEFGLQEDYSEGFRQICIREGWLPKEYLSNAKAGFDPKAPVTISMVKKWIKDNKLEGIGPSVARRFKLVDDKSGLGYGTNKMMSAYTSFVREGKLEPILNNPNGRDTGKKINQIDKNGNVINTFNKLKDAGKATGINPTSISNVLRGDTKTAGGFGWEVVS